MRKGRLRLSRTEYKNLCNKVHERDGWKCRYCKARQGLHAHHIVYRSHGGDDADWNLLTVCNGCHDAIHDRYLLVIAVKGVIGDKVDANKGVRFVTLEGWRPKRCTDVRVASSRRAGD